MHSQLQCVNCFGALALRDPGQRRQLGQQPVTRQNAPTLRAVAGSLPELIVANHYNVPCVLRAARRHPGLMGKEERVCHLGMETLKWRRKLHMKLVTETNIQAIDGKPADC